VVRLTNAPFLEDKEVIVVGENALLTFDYTFDIGNGSDSFWAFLFDSDDGINTGILETFEVSSTQSGTAGFDLTNYVGRSLGLEFELYDEDLNVGSIANVSNLALVTPTPVPEPGTIWLFSTWLIAFTWAKRKH
jgi:hypothetical protein